MKVTVRGLLRRGASCEDVETFRQEWGEEAEVNASNLQRAAELGMDLSWWAERFLEAPLLAEFERQVDSFLAGYGRQLASFWKELKGQEASLLAEEEFERQLASFWKEYEMQRAHVLITILGLED